MDKEFIKETALKLYLKLPFWKRSKFLKWHKRNGWDVFYIYEKCRDEARALDIENQREN